MMTFTGRWEEMNRMLVTLTGVTQLDVNRVFCGSNRRKKEVCQMLMVLIAAKVIQVGRILVALREVRLMQVDPMLMTLKEENLHVVQMSVALVVKTDACRADVGGSLS